MAPGKRYVAQRLVCQGPAGRRGFVYLWVLFFVAAMGVSLAAGGVLWELRVRREKERDLLAIGAEMRRAIADYYRLTPQAAKELPQRLEDLLEDKRGPALRRHLRRIYADPLTGRAEWGLVAVQGRIMGVYSLAPGVPVIRGGFSEAEQAFASATRYADWRFMAPDVVAPAAPAGTLGAAPGGSVPAMAPGTSPSTSLGASPGSLAAGQPGAPAAAGQPGAPAAAGAGATADGSAGAASPSLPQLSLPGAAER